jgi:hypothetical protein
MIVINVMEENKIIANPWIFLTDIPKEWRIRRFIEYSPEALEEPKIKM